MLFWWHIDKGHLVSIPFDNGLRESHDLYFSLGRNLKVIFSMSILLLLTLSEMYSQSPSIDFPAIVSRLGLASRCWQHWWLWPVPSHLSPTAAFTWIITHLLSYSHWPTQTAHVFNWCPLRIPIVIILLLSMTIVNQPSNYTFLISAYLCLYIYSSRSGVSESAVM